MFNNIFLNCRFLVVLHCCQNMSNLAKKRVKVEPATPLEEMDKSELINIVKKQRKSIKELETKLAVKGYFSL